MKRIDRTISKAAKRRELVRKTKHRPRQSSPPLEVVEIGETVAGGGLDELFDDGGSAGPLPSTSMIRSERLISKIHSMVAESGAKNIEEANAFLDKLGQDFFNDIAARPSDDPIDRAEQLTYDAMEAPTEREARKLLKQALDLDPGCVDALLQLAEMAQSQGAHLKLVEKAVTAGERRLGKEFFKRNKGHFWGLIETRPYMRARYTLAMSLIAAVRVPEAVAHFEAMLDLCPNDNMGVRDQLLPLYLMVDQPESAAALLARYEDDVSPTLTWGGALVHYLLRDFEKAQDSLTVARRSSPRVEKYLNHKKKLPARRGDSYIFGSEEEAIDAAAILLRAWELYPSALVWLHHGGRPGDGRYWGLATGAMKASRKK